MFKMRLSVQYETDPDGMLWVWVYDVDTNHLIASGEQLDNEQGSDTVKRVFDEALQELDN